MLKSTGRILFWSRTLLVQRPIPSSSFRIAAAIDEHQRNRWRNHLKMLVAAGVASAGLAYFVKMNLDDVSALENDLQTSVEPGSFIEGLPVFSIDDVACHQDEKNGIWISYKCGVYDITSFIKKHPGGEKILMAAGGSVEPFWSLYAIHKKPEIFAMMESYRIGNLKKGEEKLAMLNMENPYANEPVRHPVLKVHSKQPFNAEPPSALLADNYITPTDIFYVRNHLPVPVVDDTEYAIDFGGLTSGDKRVTLEDLKTKYKRHDITAALQCAGNRRSEMNKVKDVKGLQWSQAAMGNAVWSGALLRDVLLDLGIGEGQNIDNLHVQFEGMDTDPANMAYGASIPLAKALDPRSDVILAYEMNGQPLSRDHGYPVRVVVPGTVGARWVKWLARIEISSEESESHWQRNDYKGFSPSTDWESVDFSKAAAIQELPVNSVICQPQPSEMVNLTSDQPLLLKGYAWSGGGRKILRVDVSLDDGRSWVVADLIDQQTPAVNRQWAWTRWQLQVPQLQTDGVTKVRARVRAVDSSYNVQPEKMNDIWNLRGLMATAYHEIEFGVKRQE